jgi:hypothetical protein
LPVTALVGFLIGVTISYLSALQLKSFGADLFIVNILGISIIRELGPVLVAVLVAGRSGSAMTAQIGVMRVTEEIDAYRRWVSRAAIRVVLPKIIGLTVAMPLLVLWASAVALLGGMLAALLQLDLSFSYFIENLPRAVPVANLFIGLGKGWSSVSSFPGGLLFRPARQTEYRKPVVQYDQRGGHGDHHSDSGRCGFRHFYPPYWRAAAMSSHESAGRRINWLLHRFRWKFCSSRSQFAGRGGADCRFARRLRQRQDHAAAGNARAAPANSRQCQFIRVQS